MALNFITVIDEFDRADETPLALPWRTAYTYGMPKLNDSVAVHVAASIVFARYSLSGVPTGDQYTKITGHGAACNSSAGVRIKGTSLPVSYIQAYSLQLSRGGNPLSFAAPLGGGTDISDDHVDLVLWHPDAISNTGTGGLTVLWTQNLSSTGSSDWTFTLRVTDVVTPTGAPGVNLWFTYSVDHAAGTTSDTIDVTHTDANTAPNIQPMPTGGEPGIHLVGNGTFDMPDTRSSRISYFETGAWVLQDDDQTYLDP